MRILAFLAFMATLWFTADFGAAHAQELNPRVQREVNEWLDNASAFRSGTEDTARLWQRDAPLLDARTDIFVSEADAFANVTQTYAQRLANLSGGTEAANLLNEIATSLDDRLAALADARSEGAAQVMRVLGGMDRAVYEGLSRFGAANDLSAQTRPETAAPIRVAYVTDMSRTSERPARGTRTTR